MRGLTRWLVAMPVSLFSGFAAASDTAEAAPTEKVKVDTSLLGDKTSSRIILERNDAERTGGTVLLRIDALEKTLKDLREAGLLDDSVQPAEFLLDGSRRKWTQRVMDPVAASLGLIEYSSEPRHRSIAARLASADVAPCSGPAQKYDAVSEGPYADDRRKFGAQVDRHCLHSFFRWRRADGNFTSDPVPHLLEPASGAGFQALVVLERATFKGMREYVCGGLLLPGNRVQTAAHCFGETAAHRDALERGRIYARLVRAPDHPGWPIRPVVRDWESTHRVYNDTVVLSIESSDVILAPDSVFVPLAESAEPVVMGYFPDFDRSRQIEGGPVDVSTWYTGLRWARPGLCHAVNSGDRCLRLLCQTINAFSGMPVFDQSEPSSGGPLRVLGLVSRPDHPDAQCGAFLNLSTLAYTDVAAPSAAADRAHVLPPSIGWPTGEPAP